jgi:hypothetical protein
MKFLILAVFICAVLAVKEGASGGSSASAQCTLDSFVVTASKDGIFKGPPLGLKTNQGCHELLTAMYKQGQFVTIDSTRHDYGLMDTPNKRKGLAQKKKKWSRDECKGIRGKYIIASSTRKTPGSEG